jgi:hypothetical protein
VTSSVLCRVEVNVIILVTDDRVRAVRRHRRNSRRCKGVNSKNFVQFLKAEARKRVVMHEEKRTNP